MCSATLMKRDLALPSSAGNLIDDCSIRVTIISLIFTHFSLISYRTEVLQNVHLIIGEEMDAESMEALTQQIYTAHSGLLGKGLALSQLPSIHEALEGNLPFR